MSVVIWVSQDHGYVDFKTGFNQRKIEMDGAESVLKVFGIYVNKLAALSQLCLLNKLAFKEYIGRTSMYWKIFRNTVTKLCNIWDNVHKDRAQHHYLVLINQCTGKFNFSF